MGKYLDLRKGCLVGDCSKNIPSDYLYPRHRGFTLKRFGYLYEKVYDFENLYDAYLKARKSKRYQLEVVKYTSNLEENLIVLQNELIWKTYSPARLENFLYIFLKKDSLQLRLFTTGFYTMPSTI
jgi:hypothetical protein